MVHPDRMNLCGEGASSSATRTSRGRKPDKQAALWRCAASMRDASISGVAAGSQADHDTTATHLAQTSGAGGPDEYRSRHLDPNR